MNKKEIKPSAWATRLFQWLCNPEYFEELQGDMEERFYRDVDSLGPRKAQAYYRIQILKMLRPSVVKRPFKIQKLIMLSLIYINIKLTLRNIVRHKVFSAVNILGLAAALAGSLFVVNLLYTGYSMDRHHADHHRIFRLDTQVEDPRSGSFNMATTSHAFVEKIKAQIPEIQAITEVRSLSDQSFRRAGTQVGIEGISVDRSFIDIFQVEVIRGNLESVFTDINSIAITDVVAKNLFAGEDPIGKVTEEGNVIRAILGSPFGKSNITYEFIGNIETIRANMSEASLAQDNKPDFIGITAAFLKISPEATRSQLDEKLAIASEEFGLVIANQTEFIGKGRKFHFNSRALTSLNFHGQDYNVFFFYISGQQSLLFYLILFVLMALATFNYANLSAARALQRTKEISIRKINGSGSRQIIGQFLIETVIFSLLGLVLSLGLYRLFVIKSLELMPDLVSVVSLGLNFELSVVFVGYAVLTGVIAGILPSFHFARITPMSIFRTRVKTNQLSLLRLRKVLSGSQLTLSMFCILFITIGISQYRALLNAPVNFDQENIIAIDADKKTLPILKQKMEQITGVESASIVSSLPGLGINNGLEIVPTEGQADTTWIRMVGVDDHFKDVFKLNLKAGRVFQKEDNQKSTITAIVDPNFLQKFGLTAQKALDKQFKVVRSNATFQVIGVVNEYTFGELTASIGDPYIITYQQVPIFRNRGHLAVRLTGPDAAPTLSKMEKVWEESFTDDKFSPYYLEDAIENSYASFKHAIEILAYLGVIIILVSLLGQVGISLYNAERRVKEIGIRKVLGARLRSILALLLKNTLWSLLIACAIAVPAISLFYQQVVFPGLGYTINIGLLEIGSGTLLLGSLVMGLVVLQTWRIANQNPAHSLRNE